ncbi:hypothetical protein [Haloarchaeobius sp. DFWS5]|uniref:hypothetical protein n=1 Tax=Haloarchaeobius sp. DFWS5 TaxID=3446114 RepID=UPI003EBA5CBE
MHRRRFLALASSVAGAGCLGVSLHGSSGDAAPRESLDAGSTSSPNEDRFDSTATTSEPAADSQQPAQLEVLSTTSGETHVQLRLTRLEDLQTVYNRKRTLSYGERAFLSGQLLPDTDYRLDLTIEGTHEYHRTIRAGERLVFDVRSPQNVMLVEWEQLDDE